MDRRPTGSTLFSSPVTSKSQIFFLCKQCIKSYEKYIPDLMASKISAMAIVSGAMKSDQGWSTFPFLVNCARISILGYVPGIRRSTTPHKTNSYFDFQCSSSFFLVDTLRLIYRFNCYCVSAWAVYKTQCIIKTKNKTYNRH